MAAVLSAGNGAALSHLSAARLWRIWRGAEDGIHVVTPIQRAGSLGLRLHSSVSLMRRDVTMRDGIQVTSVARTLVDLADVLEVHQLANAMHEAAYLGLLNIRRMQATIDRLQGRPRIRIVQDAIEANLSGGPGTRSQLEDRCLKLISASDLAPPEVNVGLTFGTQRIEVDLLWRQQRLCVEVDGPGHRRPRTRAEDAARDHILRAHGYEILRVTGTDIERGGAGTIDAVRKLLCQSP